MQSRIPARVASQPALHHPLHCCPHLFRYAVDRSTAVKRPVEIRTGREFAPWIARPRLWVINRPATIFKNDCSCFPFFIPAAVEIPDDNFPPCYVHCDFLALVRETSLCWDLALLICVLLSVCSNCTGLFCVCCLSPKDMCVVVDNKQEEKAVLVPPLWAIKRLHAKCYNKKKPPIYVERHAIFPLVCSRRKLFK